MKTSLGVYLLGLAQWSWVVSSWVKLFSITSLNWEFDQIALVVAEAEFVMSLIT